MGASRPRFTGLRALAERAGKGFARYDMAVYAGSKNCKIGCPCDVGVRGSLQAGIILGLGQTSSKETIR